MTFRGLLIACCVATAGDASAQAAESCDARLAATHNFRNGAPANVTPLPDGSGAVYIRSGPRDLVQGLYRYDLATRTEHALALPAALLKGAAETLSVEGARPPRAHAHGHVGLCGLRALARRPPDRGPRSTGGFW